MALRPDDEYDYGDDDEYETAFSPRFAARAAPQAPRAGIRGSDEERLDFLAEVTEHEAALLKIYGRLRPGNPPQIDKAKALFKEKFFDENRYRLGKVGRFRINRKFEDDKVYKVRDESEQYLYAEDFLAVVRYIMDLRAKRSRAHVDDIDHLGNRRLRTLDELAVEEMRKGFLKLRRTVQERMSVKDPDELSRISDLVNSKSISSAIDFFFGRSELSQVVDQTPLVWGTCWVTRTRVPCSRMEVSIAI